MFHIGNIPLYANQLDTFVECYPNENLVHILVAMVQIAAVVEAELEVYWLEELKQEYYLLIVPYAYSSHQRLAHHPEDRCHLYS